MLHIRNFAQRFCATPTNLEAFIAAARAAHGKPFVILVAAAAAAEFKPGGGAADGIYRADIEAVLHSIYGLRASARY